MKDKIGKLVPSKVKGSRRKATSVEGDLVQDLSVPRITNETVAAHREEILKGARKYIYPLQQSKRHIVLITSGIVVAAILFFLAYCVVGLYRLESNNTFLYRVTQVVPFPIARTGKTFIYYENYLFELRHFVHYYETQLQSDLKSEQYKQQLEDYKKRALDQVVQDAYVKILAKQNGVSVSDQEVAERIKMVREQNRLGNNNKVFEDVLKDFWGWSVKDFERSLKNEILAEKLVAKLDAETNTKAQETLSKIKAGSSFADLAKAGSDDLQTKANGGEYGFQIEKTSRDVPPQVIDALFALKAGETSELINTGTSLEIVKVNEVAGDKVRASHIVFKYKDVNTYVNDLKDKQKVKTYVKL